MDFKKSEIVAYFSANNTALFFKKARDFALKNKICIKAKKPTPNSTLKIAMFYTVNLKLYKVKYWEFCMRLKHFKRLFFENSLKFIVK